jgi:hypothetical protein
VIIENDKYDFSKIIEDSDTENKTEFISEFPFLNFTIFSFISTPKNTSYYLFKTKEFPFKKTTPPPEIV